MTATTSPVGTAVAARASGLVKDHGSGATAVRALDGIDLEIAAGAFTAVMGPSGSGKSTLMHCLAGLDTVTEGDVEVAGTRLAGLSDDELTRFRRDHVGFVFQSFNLLPMLTAGQNIVLPSELAGRRIDRGRLAEVTRTLGIDDRLGHLPSALSGGQQQRVAIARAVLTSPAVVFADEPTGNLDSRSSAEVLGFLRRSVRELGQTVVMVTHDARAAAHADRVVFLADGRLVRTLDAPTVDGVLAALREIGA